MGRYTGPKGKLVRREGVNLFDQPKFTRILSRRNYPPGAHGMKRRPRLTVFGKQLREKQKAKRIYGVSEKQFRNYYDKAIRKKGDSGPILVKFLENRLDNVIFRMGLAMSRAHSRQMVNHGFIQVNGKKADIPSIQVRVGDTITIKENKRKSKIFFELDKKLKKFTYPEWLIFDASKFEGKITGEPNVDEASRLFDTQTIIEYYSK